jgi:hypothetical protein
LSYERLWVVEGIGSILALSLPRPGQDNGGFHTPTRCRLEAVWGDLEIDVKYEEAYARLASHSSLPATDVPEAESFVWNLWNANRTAAVPDISALCDDIIGCLAVANLELNGPVPSDSTSPNRTISVVSDIAYTVSGIIASGLRYHRLWSRTGKFAASDSNLLADEIYRIAYAWDQVLAGDMDDILEGFDISSAM